MRLLLVGGSGHVGTLVNPYLKAAHTLRVYDLRPPADATIEHWTGDVTDFANLRQAAEGMDLLLYMAMNTMKGDEITVANSSFDVNIKGVYFALRAAREAGIEHAVYCSSMSVYDGNLETRYFFDESMPHDARDVYGFTKRLGEEVCHNAWKLHGMSVNALRLCHPRARADWLKMTVKGVASIPTEAEDVARALLAALAYRNGFQAFQISGDYENKIMNMGKAKRLLGWEPLARPE